MKQRPNILSIAGFDPTSGAGLTADIKTIEALKCYGLSICTANTIQTDQQFVACHWTDSEIVRTQLKTVVNRFEITVVKIGIIQSWELLQELLLILKDLSPKVKVIWDPVLSASTGFKFYSESKPESKRETIIQVLKSVYMITPNYLELQGIFPELSREASRELIVTHTNLLLK